MENVKPCPHCKHAHSLDKDQIQCHCGALLQRVGDNWKIIAWTLNITKKENS